jgi:hypothetical protein
MFDAVNAIVGGHRGYTGLAPARDGTSMRAAIAQAVHDILSDLFPSQRASFDEQLEKDLARIPERSAHATRSAARPGRPLATA